MLNGLGLGCVARCLLEKEETDVVHIVEKSERVLPILSLPDSRAALAIVRGLGMEVRTGNDVETCEELGDGRAERVNYEYLALATRLLLQTLDDALSDRRG